MPATKAAVIISLGLFLGMLNYGLQATLINYNRLVDPEEPLKIIAVDEQGDKLSFMGENFSLTRLEIDTLKEELNDLGRIGLKEIAGDIYRRLIEDYHRYISNDGP